MGHTHPSWFTRPCGHTGNGIICGGGGCHAAKHCAVPQRHRLRDRGTLPPSVPPAATSMMLSLGAQGELIRRVPAARTLHSFMNGDSMHLGLAYGLPSILHSTVVRVGARCRRPRPAHHSTGSTSLRLTLPRAPATLPDPTHYHRLSGQSMSVDNRFPACL